MQLGSCVWPTDGRDETVFVVMGSAGSSHSFDQSGFPYLTCGDEGFPAGVVVDDMDVDGDLISVLVPFESLIDGFLQLVQDRTVDTTERRAEMAEKMLAALDDGRSRIVDAIAQIQR